MRVAICDDDMFTTRDIETVLKGYHRQNLTVEIFYRAENLAKAMLQQHYDFFILDIELPQQSGIELARHIRMQSPQVPIIFLTNYQQYMPEVFSLQTFDYLLKPISQQKLFPVLDRVLKYLSTAGDHFFFQFKQTTYSIPLAQILYFEKSRRLVIIHTLTTTYQTTMKTKTLLQHLNPDFIQVHYSFIINSRYLRSINAHTVKLGTEKISVEVPISRHFRQTAQAKIMHRLKEMI